MLKLSDWVTHSVTQWLSSLLERLVTLKRFLCKILNGQLIRGHNGSMSLVGWWSDGLYSSKKSPKWNFRWCDQHKKEGKKILLSRPRYFLRFWHLISRYLTGPFYVQSFPMLKVWLVWVGEWEKRRIFFYEYISSGKNLFCKQTLLNTKCLHIHTCAVHTSIWLTHKTNKMYLIQWIIATLVWIGKI